MESGAGRDPPPSPGSGSRSVRAQGVAGFSVSLFHSQKGLEPTGQGGTGLREDLGSGPWKQQHLGMEGVRNLGSPAHSLPLHSMGLGDIPSSVLYFCLLYVNRRLDEMASEEPGSSNT